MLARPAFYPVTLEGRDLVPQFQQLFLSGVARPLFPNGKQTNQPQLSLSTKTSLQLPSPVTMLRDGHPRPILVDTYAETSLVETVCQEGP